jgi:hypothetical protein
MAAVTAVMVERGGPVVASLESPEDSPENGAEEF